MTEQEQRSAVVEEALRWVGTPYHHGARVRGAGVDCGQLLLGIYEGAGIIPHVDTGNYPHDWHMHRDEERYLFFVNQLGRPLDNSEASLDERLAVSPAFALSPGDVMVWKVGRTYSHGGMVLCWPEIIHAYFPSRVVERVSVLGTPMARRAMRIYTYWGHE